MRALPVVAVVLAVAVAVAAQTPPSPAHHARDEATFRKFLDAVNRKDADAALRHIADSATVDLAVPENQCLQLNKTAYGEHLRASFAELAIIDVHVSKWMQHGTAFAATLDEAFVVNATAGGGVLAPFVKGHVVDGLITDMGILVGNPRATKQVAFFEGVLNALKNGSAADLGKFFTANATLEYCDSTMGTMCVSVGIADYLKDSAGWFANRTAYDYTIFRHGACCGLNAGVVSDWWTGRGGAAGVMQGFHLFETIGGGEHGAPIATAWHIFVTQTKTA